MSAQYRRAVEQRSVIDELSRNSGARDTHGVDDDDRPPICPRCGVTMVPAALSADGDHEGDWVCLECEELDEE
jgi:hypothetical protein